MKRPTFELRHIIIPLASALTLLPLAEAATITPVNQDAPFFGFNDFTAATPVGGNEGTTLGQQRLNVLQRACDLWGQHIHSDVEILVGAQFENDGGVASGFSLASALSSDVFADFPNAPLENTWYPVALANAYALEDLEPARADIEVIINIALDLQSDLPDWYYGLDGNAGPAEIDLLQTILHELAHGLGFASEFDPFTGELLLDIPDIYSLNIRDLETGKGWGEMTNEERFTSMENDPYVVWAGPYTSRAAPQLLNQKMVIVVDSPEWLAGSYEYIAALFGPPVPEEGISGKLVPVDDGVDPSTDACEPILNAAEIAGNIAYIDRGDCFFDRKVLAAQLAGAVAVVIPNNVPFEDAIIMAGENIVDGIPLTIPAVSVSWETGINLLDASPGVNLTLGVVSEDYDGTRGGHVRLHAPSSYQLGSSISHFTWDAAPDLLMEPVASPGILTLDLSLPLLKDIGWIILDIPYLHETYEQWVSWNFAPEETLTGKTDDPDGDGVLNFAEYFFNGNPEVASTDVLPVMAVNDPGMRFSYTRAVQPTDVTFAYDISTNLTNWTEAVENVDFTIESVTSLHIGAETVVLDFSPSGGSQPLFVRIRVISNDQP
jgi:hypothetical protein